MLTFMVQEKVSEVKVTEKKQEVNEKPTMNDREII